MVVGRHLGSVTRTEVGVEHIHHHRGAAEYPPEPAGFRGDIERIMPHLPAALGFGPCLELRNMRARRIISLGVRAKRREILGPRGEKPRHWAAVGQRHGAVAGRDEHKRPSGHLDGLAAPLDDRTRLGEKHRILVYLPRADEGSSLRRLGPGKNEVITADKPSSGISVFDLGRLIVEIGFLLFCDQAGLGHSARRFRSQRGARVGFVIHWSPLSSPGSQRRTSGHGPASRRF